MPKDPPAILRKLQPHVERARQAAARDYPRTKVESWTPLYGDLGHDLRSHVQQTGLLASAYYVIMCWIPRSEQDGQYDIVVCRYFEGVWADMSRRIYNIGDIAQTISVVEDAEPSFDQKKTIGSNVEIRIHLDKELRNTAARLQVRLRLDEPPFLDLADSVIGAIGGFGYRYRATKSIVDHGTEGEQTNEFLGAPIVIPCRRFYLLVCVPKSSVRGFPIALAFSNRAMLKLLVTLDDAEPDELDSLLWPIGRKYETSVGPGAPLKPLERPDTTLDVLPGQLQEAISQPADSEKGGQSIRDIICRQDSRCFLLDLHQPHPSLTHTIVWRLS